MTQHHDTASTTDTVNRGERANLPLWRRLGGVSRFALILAVAGAAGFAAGSLGQNGAAVVHPQSLAAASQPCATAAAGDTFMDSICVRDMVQPAFFGMGGSRAMAPPSFAPLVERVSPAVVSIRTERRTRDARVDGALEEWLEEMRRFGFPVPDMRRFGQPERGGEAPLVPSLGSGFIVDAEGYIVTNNHVIQGAENFRISLSDGREFEATLVGADPETDLAVLRINTDETLPYVEFANGDGLRVGDWVIAVGNPFGLGGTVTAGIVSAFGRDLGGQFQYTDYIQIDAPINRGNSGGPTFDMSGRVVGVNSAIFSPSGGNVGIGFAIPADLAADVVAALRQEGAVERGWLGVQVQQVDDRIAESVGLDQARGALVAQVLDGTPAANAGIERGDIITRVNDREVSDARDLTRAIAALRSGERARFTVWRDGREQVKTATLGRRPGQDQMASLGPDATPEGALSRRLGLDLHTAVAGEDGVQVRAVQPNSEAQRRGIRPGERILTVNGVNVSTAQEVEEALASAASEGRRSVLLLVRARNNTERFVGLRIERS
jgi:serine protease Do